MEFVEIHGKKLEYDSKLEYGLYLSDGILGFQNYVNLYVPQSADGLNKFDKNNALLQAQELKKQAEIQLKWKTTPGIIGSPILISNKKSVPIDEVRKNIENTKLLADNIINILGGK
jgi:hypothetical protein